MKIQCACGAKFSFDITPEITASPVQFVCPACGLNSTSLVNQLIQQHAAGILPAPGGRATTVLPAGAGPAAVAVPVAPAKPAVPVKPAVRVAVQVRAPEPVAEVETPADAPLCLKHFGQPTTERCMICQKPICPECMALFGWVCSPLCRGKAEAQGIAIPQYEGQRSVVERREWRETARLAGVVAAVLALVVGAWAWYAWIGSTPRTRFSAKFPEPAPLGEFHVAVPGQIVVLHGDHLSRQDVKAKRQVWSVALVDRSSFGLKAAIAVKAMLRAQDEAVLNGADRDDIRLPSEAEIMADLIRASMAALTLHVAGENIWVQSPGKLVRYDWATGNPVKEIALDETEVARRGNELVLVAEREEGGSEIRRIDLASGQVKQESIAPPVAVAAAARTNTGPAVAARDRPGVKPVGGVSSNLLARSGLLPGSRQIDPMRVAREAQNLPLPNRLALPATLAAAANQERLRKELNDGNAAALDSFLAGALEPEGDASRVIPTAGGFVQFSSHVVERRLVTRKAMKDPSGKSALDGPINQAATAAIANEILNEMARERGGDSITEDESRCQVTLRRPGCPDWTGEVVGEPDFVSGETVDAVTGGKSIVILDKHNRKLWEARFTYPIQSGGGDGPRPFGAGPIVERGDTLYVFDAGVLTAFELKTGTARWRLPSSGIVGLHFDDKGMIYVNTTTANPESVRLSKQIDISAKTHNLVLKLDPKSGRTLWRAENDGFVNYVSGKFIYSVEASAGDAGSGLFGATPVPPHIRIKRLKPSNGRVLWEHFESRAPLSYEFEKNEIRLLFSKELEVLHFLTL